MKENAFFIIFKGFSMMQIKKKTFLEGESPTLKVYLQLQVSSLKFYPKINPSHVFFKDYATF